MKVGLRIALATTLVVAALLTVYSFYNIRDSDRARKNEIRENLEILSLGLRRQIESDETLLAQLQTSQRVKILSPALISPLYKMEVVPLYFHPDSTDDVRAVRFNAFTEGQSKFLFLETESHSLYTLPVRALLPTPEGKYPVIGILDVSISHRFVELKYKEDLTRNIKLILLLIVSVFLTVFFFSRSLVTTPIAKLLTGVHDVAQGDLSRVLLAEREDEIGILAARFNEMTFSLRESRKETSRQTESRIELEQKLFQTEKLATIGQIAAEIAHEVGTPLNVISGRSRGLQRKSNDPVAVKKNALIISEQSARITRIIQRLLDFSRSKVGEEENQEVDLNAICLHTLEFLESKLATAYVKYSLQQEKDLPTIDGNPDKILQVIINLVLNATEAMQETGGNLIIRTSQQIGRRPGLGVAAELSIVLVEVTDTGPGIPEEEQSKIFEPFYSSKISTGGTGLGLAVVHGIVKAHDGWIEYSNSSSGGSIFTVFFPASEPASKNI